MCSLKVAILSLSMLLAAGNIFPASAAISDLSKLHPWPKSDGNYLQLLQGEAGQWYLVSAVVRRGHIAIATGKVVTPKDPSAMVVQHVPFASIFVDGIECESLQYKHLPLNEGGEYRQYWMAVPRGFDQAKPSCQIKNPPDKWEFVTS
ncbi:hypothetical protein [Pseudomonas citronellolis]|uniref:hypothetical protein n=1 Tax=Pseudomonas citronellolis TaxID=53408 RepID=UPI001066F9D5|nr:hypothetical protein [Pseudomonas humi]